MADKNYEDIGSIKYSGQKVEGGVIDAGSAGSALLGLDEALRFFNGQQLSSDYGTHYDIPIRIQDGSWEAVILAGLGAPASVFALSYTKKAAEKMAEKDFSDFGLKDVLKKSLSAIKNLIKLIKHTRQDRGWEQLKLVDDHNKAVVEIANEKQEVIAIPYEHFRWYQNLPPRLLVRLTAIVEEDRVLTVETRNDFDTDQVEVRPADKILFEQTQDMDEPDEFFLS